MNNNNDDGKDLEHALGYIHYLERSVHDLRQELESLEGRAKQRNDELDEEVTSSRRTASTAAGDGEDLRGLPELKVSKIDHCAYSLQIVCQGDDLSKVARVVENLDVEVVNAHVNVLDTKSNCYYLVKNAHWDKLSIAEIKKSFTDLYSSMMQ